MQVIASAIDLGDGMSIERAQPSTALKSMPHITTFSGFLSDQMSPVSAHQLNCQEPINIIPDDLNNSERMVTPQSQFARSDGSVIVGDNHFRTGGGDSLTGIDSDGPKYMTGQVGITNQLEHGPGLHDSVHCLVGGTMCSVIRGEGDNKGSFNSQGFRNLIGNDAPGGMTYLTETFDPIPGMYSFGESLNPALEFGGAFGPDGTSFMTGNIGFPNNNLTGSAIQPENI